MTRCVLAAVVGVLCVGTPLTAGETKVQKPSGTWTRTAGDVTVTFRFEADTLRCTLSAMGLAIDIDADYGMSKDGVIFGRISKVDKKGVCIGPSVGDLFTFRFRVKGETLTISDLGPQEHRDARELIEGDYKAAAKKK